MAQVFSCEFRQISKNTVFTERLWTTSSGGWIDNKAQGHQRSGKFINHQSKTCYYKFNGTPIDWIVFWNQFEAEMDKSNQPYMFSYLKETLEPKVRLLVHGLPFNTEDCTS